jgi:serine/threonine protein kinase
MIERELAGLKIPLYKSADLTDWAYLGQGHYGTVYRVRLVPSRLERDPGPLSSQDVMAVKVSPFLLGSLLMSHYHLLSLCPPPQQMNGSCLEALLGELDVLLQCRRCPGVVGFRGVCESEGSWYICMEWMDALSLQHQLVEKGTGIPEPVLAQVFRLVTD